MEFLVVEEVVVGKDEVEFVFVWFLYEESKGEMFVEIEILLKMDVLVLILDGFIVFIFFIGFFLLLVKDEFVEVQVNELVVVEDDVFEDVRVFVNFFVVSLSFDQELVKVEMNSIEVEFDIIIFELIFYKVSIEMVIENEGVVNDVEFMVVDLCKENVGFVEQVDFLLLEVDYVLIGEFVVEWVFDVLDVNEDVFIMKDLFILLYLELVFGSKGIGGSEVVVIEELGVLVVDINLVEENDVVDIQVISSKYVFEVVFGSFLYLNLDICMFENKMVFF